MSATIGIPKHTVRCPYCGHKNTIQLNWPNMREAVCCEHEDGGCEQYFFVMAQAHVIIESETHKIAGFVDAEPAHDAQDHTEPDMRRTYL